MAPEKPLLKPQEERVLSPYAVAATVSNRQTHTHNSHQSQSWCARSFQESEEEECETLAPALQKGNDDGYDMTAESLILLLLNDS